MFLREWHKHTTATCTVMGLTIAAACTEPKNASKADSFVGNYYQVGDQTKPQNFLVAFLGSSNGIEGTLKDIGHLSNAVNPTNGYNIKMAGPNGQGWTNATTQTFISETANVAATMLPGDKAAYANMQKGGTLFFYVTSHGAEDGSTVDSNDETFFFSSVAQAIVQKRGGVPLERLIVMFDTCFSGQNVTGNQAITQTTGGGGVTAGSATTIPPPATLVQSVGDTSGQQLATGNRPTDRLINQVVTGLLQVPGFYKSGIFIAASRPDLESQDTESGGQATNAFVNAIKAAAGKTVEQVLVEFATASGEQQPVWCVEPAELTADKFIDPKDGSLPKLIPDARVTKTRACGGQTPSTGALANGIIGQGTNATVNSGVANLENNDVSDDSYEGEE